MAQRIEKFRTETANAISLSEKYSWNFQNFDIQGEILTFSWSGKNSATFSLCVTEDYPENSLLTYVDEKRTDIVHKTVPLVIQNLHSELIAKEHKEEGDSLSNPNFDRLISKESDQSDYMDCASGVDTDDYELEDYYGEKDYGDPLDDGNSVHQFLESDVEQVKLIYGEKAVSYRRLNSINEIDVDLNIPVLFLEKEVTNAWKINRDEPLVVRLHLCSYDYLDYQAPPKVEVLQVSKKEKFSVGVQLAKILETFLLEQWKKMSNSVLETAVSRTVSMPTDLCSFTKDNETPTDEDSITNNEIFNVDDGALCQIVDMGFSVDVARNSLIITRGNIQEALNVLVTNSESIADIGEGLKPEIQSKKPNPPLRQTSHPSSFKRYKKNTNFIKRQQSLVSSVTSPNLASNAPIEDLTLLPYSTINGLNSKNIPSLENGFLVQVFRYARQRIPTLNEYCVICDEPHVFHYGAMLKPAVCSRELCVFSYQTLHVMQDAADDITTAAEVIDLLVTMTKAACNHTRKKVIFDPYPTIVDPKKPNKLALNPKCKDYVKVQEILNSIPDMTFISQLNVTELKAALDSRHFLSYSLLQWIIASNRSHIVKLSPDRIILSMATPHQFLLRNSPPAKEAKFQTEKEKYGSTFAFHGSSIENWHSIIREGLIVASGTEKQMNGAAHGKGIYLSPTSSVSFGYSKMGYGAYNTKKGSTANKKTSRFLTSKNITCIAICEVITSPELKKCSTIWVAPKSDHVCTRFFFVYEDGQVGDNSIDTQNVRYRLEIDKAMAN